jgi:hypothetical protein
LNKNQLVGAIPSELGRMTVVVIAYVARLPA